MGGKAQGPWGEVKNRFPEESPARCQSLAPNPPEPQYLFECVAAFPSQQALSHSLLFNVAL